MEATDREVIRNCRQHMLDPDDPCELSKNLQE